MEVQVTDTFGLEDDVLVSIRYGTVRRQAPLESVKSHPFKFPAQLEDLSEPLKIDLLKPVASTRLVLHPKEEHYSIGFEQEDSIAMGLHVMAGAPEATEANSGGAKDAGAKDSASSAKDYLEQKGLLKYVQSLLHAVIQDKPSDPFSYMIEQLTAAKSKSMACERVMSRPTSAMSRPTSAVSRPPGTRPQSARPNPPKQKPVSQAPAPRDAPPAFPAEPVSPPAKAPTRQIPERQKDPRVQKALQKCDERAEAKQDLMQKLLGAAESGNLGAVLSSIGLDQSRQRIQMLLEQSAESGDLEAALKLAMNQKELEEVLRLKTEMRDALQGATDSGEMQTVLGAMAEEQQSERVQTQLRDALFEANESGKMNEILEEMAAQRGATAAADESEQLKVQLRDALMDANDSGKMTQVLDAMAAESKLQGELSDIMSVKMQLKNALAEANELGKVKELLVQIASEKAPAGPSAADEQILSQLRGLLEEANESGKLPEVLKEMSAEKAPAAAAATSGSASPPSMKAPAKGTQTSKESSTQKSVSKAILDAAKSGQLAEVLDGMATSDTSPEGSAPALEPVVAVAAVPVKPKQEEVVTLKENVRAKMEESLANGKLEQGLVTLQRKKSQEPGAPAAAAAAAAQPTQPNTPTKQAAEQEDLKKLGQEICGVLQEASKSGKLDEALELLRQEQQEVVQAAPQDEMDAVRKNLGNLMKDALLSGQLVTALEELKTKGEEITVTDIHAIKAKFKKLLREALEKGILGSKVGILKLIPKAPPSPPSGSPPDEMDVLKIHLREALQHAAEAGHLAEALASLRSGPAEGVQETMQELQNTLTEAALSGTLAETLRSLREAGPGFKPKAEESTAEAAATEEATGSPAEAAHPQSAEEKELEDLRCKLRNILSGAYDRGVLEEAVQQAIRTQTQSAADALPALKAQVAQMRSESETLHATVERLLREKEELQRANESLEERLVTHVDP